MKKALSFLLVFLLFVTLLPSALVPEADAYGGDVASVSTLAELAEAVKKDDAHVILSGDIQGSGNPILLTISGNGVLLDLNNHTLTNTNPGSASQSSTAIYVSSSDVRITNGTIIGGGTYSNGIRTGEKSGNVEINGIKASNLRCIIEGYAGESREEYTTVRVSNCTLIQIPGASTGAVKACYRKIVYVKNTSITCGGYEGDAHAGIYPAFSSVHDGLLRLSSAHVYRNSQGALIEFSYPTSVPVCGDVLAPYATIEVDGQELNRSLKFTSGSSGDFYQINGSDLRVSTEPEPVHTVAVTLTAPAIGNKPDYAATLPATVYRPVSSQSQQVQGMSWLDETAGSSVNKTTGVFQEKHRYKVTMFLCAEAGYEFLSSTKVTFNGVAASEISLSSDGILQAVYQFPALVAKPKITAQPSSTTVALNNVVNLKVTATGTDLNYQWQYSEDCGKTWKNSAMEGAKSAMLPVKGIAARNGLWYKCIVKNSAGSVTSNAVALTVSGVKPTIRRQPASRTTSLNDTEDFSVKAYGSGLSYQWQYSADGGKTWQNSTMTGAKTSILPVKAIAARNGLLYKCVVKNSYGSVTSSSCKLTVSGVKPTIRIQPASQTVSSGNTVNFTVSAAGTGLSYQWQYSTDGGKTWQNSTMTGAKTATLPVKGIAARNGLYYRCVVKNSYGSATSGAAKLTVK